MLVSTAVYAQHKQSGKATYYANSLHGRKTSSGEIYNKDSLTCAHRTLPFGTLLKVRDKLTGKEVVVEVTDRGPYSSAIIDLSMAAAKELGMCRRGVAMVEISELTADDIKALTPSVDPVIDYEQSPYPQLMVQDADGKGYIPMWQWAEQNRKTYDSSLAAETQSKTETDAARLVLPGRWQSTGRLSAASN